MTFLINVQADGDFQAVSKLDASNLVGVDWYENIYADTLPDVVQGCVRTVFNKDDDGNIIMQYGYHSGGISGDVETRLLLLNQQGKSGRFSANNKSLGRKGEVIILDHADNWDWVAYANTTGDNDQSYISVLSKAQRNLNGIERLKLTGKYKKGSHHLDLQTDKCDYKNILGERENSSRIHDDRRKRDAALASFFMYLLII